ncbi:MAG: redoxin domain-containing protein, partial [Phycisphaerales bacterium]|nr:redoxin domain-containing protein [Phycisphaerales bacterium]
PVVVFFYPHAYSSVCTEEFCGVRDDWSAWSELNANVVGISVNTPFVVAQWKQDLGLPFELLSDFNKDISAAYDAMYDEFFGLKGVAKRSAYVIGTDGTIAYAWQTEDAGVQPDMDAIKAALA